MRRGGEPRTATHVSQHTNVRVGRFAPNDESVWLRIRCVHILVAFWKSCQTQLKSQSDRPPPSQSPIHLYIHPSNQSQDATSTNVRLGKRNPTEVTIR